jgi:hypothetical protein
MIFLIYCFHFHFVHLDWKGWKCTLSSNHLARIHKTNHVNSKIDQKMGELLCFQQCLQSIDVSSILIEFEQCKKIKWKNEQPWTLGYTLVLQTVSSCLSCFFLSGPIGFPSKMMPCKLNQNLICLGSGDSCKSLGTNLKLLTKRNFIGPCYFDPSVKWHWVNHPG